MLWIKELPTSAHVRRKFSAGSREEGREQGWLLFKLHGYDMDPRELPTSPLLPKCTCLHCYTRERSPPLQPAPAQRPPSLRWLQAPATSWEHACGMGKGTGDFPLPKINRKCNPECRENTKDVSGDSSSFKIHPCQGKKENKKNQPNQIAFVLLIKFIVNL